MLTRWGDLAERLLADALQASSALRRSFSGPVASGLHPEITAASAEDAASALRSTLDADALVAAARATLEERFDSTDSGHIAAVAI
jgi:hypothetical protein